MARGARAGKVNTGTDAAGLPHAPAFHTTPDAAGGAAAMIKGAPLAPEFAPRKGLFTDLFEALLPTPFGWRAAAEPSMLAPVLAAVGGAPLPLRGAPPPLCLQSATAAAAPAKKSKAPPREPPSTWLSGEEGFLSAAASMPAGCAVSGAERAAVVEEGVGAGEGVRVAVPARSPRLLSAHKNGRAGAG